MIILSMAHAADWASRERFRIELIFELLTLAEKLQWESNWSEDFNKPDKRLAFPEFTFWPVDSRVGIDWATKVLRVTGSAEDYLANWEEADPASVYFLHELAHLAAGKDEEEATSLEDKLAAALGFLHDSEFVRPFLWAKPNIRSEEIASTYMANLELTDSWQSTKSALMGLGLATEVVERLIEKSNVFHYQTH